MSDFVTILTLKKENREQLKKVAELNAYIAELEEDKRRLDWIRENLPSICRRTHGNISFTTLHNYWEEKTFDEAINKAMS